MRRLAKSSEPSILLARKREWTQNYLSAVRERGRPGMPWAHPEIRAALTAETKGRCAYCDASIANVATAHIEHYRPRKKYPELVVEWANLTIACPRCNSKKGDSFSEDIPFVNPFSDDPEAHLIFLADLVFAPDSCRGQHTISTLGLNDEDVVQARKRRLVNLERLVRSWHRAPEPMRSGILAEIYDNLEEEEYRASADSLVKVARIESATGAV